MYMFQRLYLGGGKLLSDSGLRTFSYTRIVQRGWVNRAIMNWQPYVTLEAKLRVGAKRERKTVVINYESLDMKVLEKRLLL